MWHARVEQWERNLARARFIVDSTLVAHNQTLAGRYRILLNSLSDDVEALREDETAGVLPQDLWNKLVKLDQEWRDVFGTLLDFLGGVGITNDNQGIDLVFMAKAQTWLDALRQELGLDRELFIVAAPGPLLHTTMGVVRVPLLEWDCLHLPLLVRALGLVAAAEDAKRGGHLADIASRLQPEVQALRYDEPPRPLRGPDGWERQYIDQLFADMFATVVLGPLYVIATFVLDLDWATPEQPDIEDPDIVEVGSVGPQFLPSPVARAVAMLATLRWLNADSNRPTHQAGPYTNIIGKLEQLAQTAGADLAPATARWEAWHAVILDEVMPHHVGHLRSQAARIWQAAKTNYGKWSRSKLGSRLLPRTALDPYEFITFLSAIWLYRLDNPERSAMLRDAATAILRGRDAVLPPTGPSADDAVIAKARLDHATRRWQCLQATFQHPGLFPANGPPTAGRFLRLLSEQVYSLEEARAQIGETASVPAIWRHLQDVEEKARPLRREAFEFLGGRLVEDREPASLAGGAAGPSIRALADDLLRDYVARTGVNCSARTVLGRDAFVQAHTSIIRVRFPDWSLWSLPLVAHEFGHLVAQATPRFGRGRREVRTGAAGAELAAQFEELFADVFAVYTMGPAFACDAILLEFNPAQAYEPRERHPTHAERVGVILQTLRAMNERTCGVGNRGQYASIIGLLEERWCATLAETGARRQDETLSARNEERALAWGARLLAIVERSYRLGAGYTPDRWTWAQEAAKHFVPLVTSIAQLRQDLGVKGLRLPDLLNALWYARARGGTDILALNQLQSVTMQLGREYAGR
jgi:hypothetical protein